MAKVFIGAGGWSYFKVPGMDSLKAYANAFNFVEVNTTFYRYPEVEMVKSWRERVQSDFVFTVRAHKNLTHKNKLEPIDSSYECVEKMIKICKILDSPILHIQTPPSLKIDNEKIESIKNFFDSADFKGIGVAWEIRGTDRKSLPKKLITLMQNHDIIHCIDLSVEEPAVPSNILYTRLFGKGEHNIYQFTDDELEGVYDKSKEYNPKISFLTVHGTKMYKDAARLKLFVDTGKFPRVTKATGLASLAEVLNEDAKFPRDKKGLIRQQGWKVIDITPTKRIHASEILKKLPEKTYKSVKDVVQALEEEGCGWS